MKYLKYLFLLSICILFLIPKTYALESVTVYTSPQKTTSGKVVWYNLITPGTQSLGSVQSTASYGFEYFIEKPTVVGKVYKLRMNFNDYDYLHSNKIDYLKVQNYQGTTNLGECAVLTFQLLNVGGNTQYKNVEFTYTCSQSGSGIYVINQDQDNLTRISTIDWRLNSIQWEQLQDTEANLIIANASANTQNIINNQNDNTQEIINNQNQNTDEIINSQKACKIYDKSSVIFKSQYLGSSGNIGFTNNYGITDFINIQDSTMNVISSNSTSWVYGCFYTNTKSLIYCESINNFVGNVTFPNTAKFFRTTIYTSGNSPQFEICKNGNQAIIDSNQDVIDSQQETNDILTDDDIGGSADDAGDFINNFNTSTFGLTSIITAPLNLIQSLTSSSCTKLEIPLPYLNNKKIELPCMTPIYQSTFGTLFTMYQTITFGIIAYWVCVRIFNMVKDFKNPEHDEIEVVDL